jgi:hypothetical protein
MDLGGRTVVPGLNDSYTHLIRAHLIRSGLGSPALAPGGLAVGGADAGSGGISGQARLLPLPVLSRR